MSKFREMVKSIEEEIRNDVATHGLAEVAKSYNFTIGELEDMTEEEFIDACVTAELHIASV